MTVLLEHDRLWKVCVQEERQMEKILVYLGSDHVIQHPSFGVRENILKLTTDREVAISQACVQDAVGEIGRASCRERV